MKWFWQIYKNWYKRTWLWPHDSSLTSHQWARKCHEIHDQIRFEFNISFWVLQEWQWIDHQVEYGVCWSGAPFSRVDLVHLSSLTSHQWASKCHEIHDQIRFEFNISCWVLQEWQWIYHQVEYGVCWSGAPFSRVDLVHLSSITCISKFSLIGKCNLSFWIITIPCWKVSANFILNADKDHVLFLLCLIKYSLFTGDNIPRQFILLLKSKEESNIKGKQLPQIECVASISRRYKYALEVERNDNTIFSGCQIWMATGVECDRCRTILCVEC
jgi:hypothetical protein